MIKLDLVLQVDETLRCVQKRKTKLIKQAHLCMINQMAMIIMPIIECLVKHVSKVINIHLFEQVLFLINDDDHIYKQLILINYSIQSV